MKIARELEKRLERIVDGLSAALFGGKMHPVDLANRLVRQADLMVVDGPRGPEIPNHFEVRVDPDDLGGDIAREDLERELAFVLSATAAERGWRLGGPVSVELVDDDSIVQGSIESSGEYRPGVVETWGEMIEVGGVRTYELRDNRILIGRGTDCDVVVSEPEVSRHHALLTRQSGQPWLEDLGSANGTFHNGAPLDDEMVELTPGDELRFGPTTFLFRLT